MLAARCVFAVGPDALYQRAAHALVRLLHHPKEVKYLALLDMLTLASTHASLFEPCYTYFYVFVSDPQPIREAKLDMLCLLCTEGTIQAILAQLQVLSYY